MKPANVDSREIIHREGGVLLASSTHWLQIALSALRSTMVMDQDTSDEYTVAPSFKQPACGVVRN